MLAFFWKKKLACHVLTLETKEKLDSSPQAFICIVPITHDLSLCLMDRFSFTFMGLFVGQWNKSKGKTKKQVEPRCVGKPERFAYCCDRWLGKDNNNSFYAFNKLFTIRNCTGQSVCDWLGQK